MNIDYFYTKLWEKRWISRRSMRSEHQPCICCETLLKTQRKLHRSDRQPLACSPQKMWSGQQILPNNKQHETNVISNATFVPYSWTDPWKCFLSRHKDNLTVLIERFMRIIIIWFLFLKSNPWGVFALLRCQQIIMWYFIILSPAVISITINSVYIKWTKSITKGKVCPKIKRYCRFKCGVESKTCPDERDSSESRCPHWIWSFQRANTSETILWHWIHCGLKQRLWPTAIDLQKESRWSLSYLSAGFVKRRGVQCFGRTAGVHHLHRCCVLLLWQQQLSALNTDIWPVSSAHLDSDVVLEHHRFLHSYKCSKFLFCQVSFGVRAVAGQMGALSKIVMLCPLRQTLWK